MHIEEMIQKLNGKVLDRDEMPEVAQMLKRLRADIAGRWREGVKDISEKAFEREYMAQWEKPQD